MRAVAGGVVFDNISAPVDEDFIAIGSGRAGDKWPRCWHSGSEALQSLSVLSFRSPRKLNPRPRPFRVSLTSVEVPCGKRKGCLPVITLIYSRHFPSLGYRPVWACSAAKPELDSVFGVFDLR